MRKDDPNSQYDPEFDPGDPDVGDKKPVNKFKKYAIFGIIGVIILAIVIPLALRTPATSGETSSAVETDVSALKKWRTATDESLAGLWEMIDSLETTVESLEIPESTNWSETIKTIQSNIADIEVALAVLEDELADYTDWAPAIAILQGKIDDIQDTVDGWMANWASNTSVVTRVEGAYIDVAIPAGGDYPIIVTLYGDGLEPDKIKSRYDYYDIIEAWVVDTSSGNMLTVVVEHDNEWEEGDLIELKVTTGMVDYASAVIGEKQEGGGTSW